MSKSSRLSLISRPLTKRDVRRVLEFFFVFSSLHPECGRFDPSNLVAKDKPAKVVWTELEEDAFHQFKQALYECTRHNLYTTRYGEPFGVHVDASKYAVRHV